MIVLLFKFNKASQSMNHLSSDFNLLMDIFLCNMSLKPRGLVLKYPEYVNPESCLEIECFKYLEEWFLDNLESDSSFDFSFFVL